MRIEVDLHHRADPEVIALLRRGVHMLERILKVIEDHEGMGDAVHVTLIHGAPAPQPPGAK